MNDNAPATAARLARPPHRLRWWLVGTALALTVAFGIAEWRGWPFLAQPAARWLSQRLERTVSLTDAQGANSFRLHLLGGIRLTVGQLQIDNPPAIALGPMVQAQALQVAMGWGQALRWRPGRTLVLQSLRADRLNLRLQRLADGRASWPAAPAAEPAKPARPLNEVIQIGSLAVAAGDVRYVDEPTALDLTGQFSSETVPGASGANTVVLRANARGQFRRKPVQATLRADGVVAWLSDAADAPAVPVTLALTAGRAELHFDGTVRDLLQQRDVRGRYTLRGPSLAAVGEPVGVTLPQTHRFAMSGRLAQQGPRWYTVVDQATVGSSTLAGEFMFERRDGAPPMLAGRLHGSSLKLQDLGPAVGGAIDDSPRTVRSAGRVLPDRDFDLPSLRAMNADVLIDLARFDFGTAQLQAAAPLRAHLVLQDGLLAVRDIDARLAQGQLSGAVTLDGRQPVARWDVDLRARGLLIEQWIKPVQRANGQTPYATGRLGGRLALTGTGKSTADLLGSADGRVQLHWTQGTVSHLLIEGAGLDLAQGLGVLVSGDKPLPVQCGAGDLTVKRGVATPQVLLIDTADSLLWLQGSVSLADEKLALTAQVQPKDFSLLTLRSPLHIDGSFGAPALSLDKPALLRKLLPAALLAMVNPLVGLLPLIDLGQSELPNDGCRAVAARYQQAVAQSR
jgi:uncharacterized protein involved in outer membrane biogenesis